jgi:integrase
VIHLGPEAVGLLEAHLATNPTGPLLRNRCGRPWTTWALVRAMVAARKKAGLLQAVCYGYRHGWQPTPWPGVPDAQVPEVLGHAWTATLHHYYSHLTARALKDALGRVRG